jgi:hypothetical protein
MATKDWKLIHKRAKEQLAQKIAAEREQERVRLFLEEIKDQLSKAFESLSESKVIIVDPEKEYSAYEAVFFVIKSAIIRMKREVIDKYTIPRIMQQIRADFVGEAEQIYVCTQVPDLWKKFQTLHRTFSCDVYDDPEAYIPRFYPTK